MLWLLERGRPPPPPPPLPLRSLAQIAMEAASLARGIRYSSNAFLTHLLPAYQLAAKVQSRRVEHHCDAAHGEEVRVRNTRALTPVRFVLFANLVAQIDEGDQGKHCPEQRAAIATRIPFQQILASVLCPEVPTRWDSQVKTKHEEAPKQPKAAECPSYRVV